MRNQNFVPIPLQVFCWLVLSVALTGIGFATDDTTAVYEREEKPQSIAQVTAPVRQDSLSEQMKRFLRIKRDENRKSVAMQTSVTRYMKTLEDGQRVTVDLIGVVHIGNREYYEKLNEIFQKYDAVLYELVAPEGTRIPKGGRIDDGMNPLAALQRGMKSVLELEFQLDHVDYTVENFVHADMTPEEFSESMVNNEESIVGMFMKALGQGLANSNRSGPSDTELLLALMSRNRAQRLRQMAAEQMEDLESGMVIFSGKDGSTIINHRNRKAFTVLDREIEIGKRHLAVFYGAGHLPDMENLLMNERGMKRAGQYWLDAWHLR
ncbi:MAG TPA: hypothetical protein PKD64_00405 [Pirellulaceae bacterium]|nr:hypothetical protein [Pirellulaceae bacterium]HMO90630.1 hypothetical protein [Pirellulaceae bacterium]HMP67791.1 hypothetical protein [Pirellulaceae bacterium]